MDKEERDAKDAFFPANSTLNANIQPERTDDLKPYRMGLPSWSTSLKQERIICKKCGQEFLNKEELKSHLYKAHQTFGYSIKRGGDEKSPRQKSPKKT